MSPKPDGSLLPDGYPSTALDYQMVESARSLQGVEREMRLPRVITRFVDDCSRWRNRNYFLTAQPRDLANSSGSLYSEVLPK